MKVKQEPIGVLRVFTEHRQGNKINADVELFSVLCLLEHFCCQLYLVASSSIWDYENY